MINVRPCTSDHPSLAAEGSTLTVDETHRGPTKLEVQVDLIVKGLSSPGREVGVSPPDWRETNQVNYLYEREAILVRDEDVARVQELVGGEPDDNLINGLTLLRLRGQHIPDVLRRVDDGLGVGVATPNHVLSVAPLIFCPATEPEVPPIAGPDPGVCPDRDGGKGVLVSVVDTGLIVDAVTAHSWLAGVTGDAEDPFDASGRIRP